MKVVMSIVKVIAINSLPILGNVSNGTNRWICLQGYTWYNTNIRYKMWSALLTDIIVAPNIEEVPWVELKKCSKQFVSQTKAACLRGLFLFNSVSFLKK
jgi:hypothetical protein